MSSLVLKRKIRWREVAVFAAVFLAASYLLLPAGNSSRHFHAHDSKSLPYLAYQWTPGTQAASASHEIDSLITQAFQLHKSTLSRATTNVADGAAAYRRRRGRQPPPGFDTWYANALQCNAVNLEDYFDQVYEDLEPFWSVTPRDLRNTIADWKYTLSVRNGKVLDIPQGRHRSRTWGEMLRKLAPHLPDLDIMINPFDEPRVVAPWDVIDSAHKAAVEQQRRMSDLPVTDFELQIKPHDETERRELDIGFTTEGNAWNLFTQGCPWAGSQAKDQPSVSSSTFVTNWTASKDICLNAELADIHGAMINPATLSTTQELIPIFSAAKYSTNNDILLPAPSYYAEDALFSVKSWFGDPSSKFKWSDKTNGLVWRGKATGGSPTESTWHMFHRQRLVAMLNSSEVDRDSAEISRISESMLGATASPESVAKWLSQKTNVGFTDLFCGPDKTDDPTCQVMTNHYALVPEIRMDEQYRWKYLPDIDGNSLSGRFRAFLRSNSAPMKSTIVKEWHDSRLTPWVHFIPVDISFRDLWSVMAYFLPFGSRHGHDEQGRNIALAGQQWSDSVLRREDMLLYMHRVLLEYARLCSDDRDRLGYVADLTKNGR